jgi:putative transposase
MLRTGCQWRLLPHEFPPWGTVYHYFRNWKNGGVWARLRRTMYKRVRKHAGRSACPSVVIMDGQSVKTTERGGVRGFDAHKRVKGRKRHILVDTLGFRSVALAYSDLTDKLGVAHFASISLRADILGVLDVCVVCIPEPGGASA